MRSLLFISAICLQLCWTYGDPAPIEQGVGSFSYQDSSGKRYSGTYGVKDGKVNVLEGDNPEIVSRFTDFNTFPEYFKNLDTVLQETFGANIDAQKKAFSAAQKAFEQVLPNKVNAGFVPNFASRFNPGGNTFTPGFSGFGAPSFSNFGGFGMPNFPNFGSMPGFGFNNAFGNGFGTGFGGVPRPNFGAGFGPGFGAGFGGFGAMPGFNNFGGFQNSATAAAAAGPGFTSHFDAINPGNPKIPNVNFVSRFGESGGDGKPGMYSVSSTSYSTSSNLNGKQTGSRGAETVVNNNGDISKYSVHS